MRSKNSGRGFWTTEKGSIPRLFRQAVLGTTASSGCGNAPQPWVASSCFGANSMQEPNSTYRSRHREDTWVGSRILYLVPQS